MRLHFHLPPDLGTVDRTRHVWRVRPDDPVLDRDKHRQRLDHHVVTHV